MIFEAADLSVSRGKVQILQSLNFVIRPGELVTIIGPNGSGKTTLLRTLAGLHVPSSGTVLADHCPIGKTERRELAKKIAYLPQTPNSPSGLTVEELVSYGRFPYRRHLLPMTQRDREIVEQVLVSTGMISLRKHPLAALSGGERQKAWIAMTFAQTPELLLLDEPTTYLDPACQMEILQMIRDFSRQSGKSVLMVLHDINMALRVSDRITVLKEGRIFADGTPEKTVTPELLKQAFGISSEFLHNSEGMIQVVPRFPEKQKL